MKCCADKAGLDGCQSPVLWVIRAASFTLYACGRHLNQVCLSLVNRGLEFMTLSIYE